MIAKAIKKYANPKSFVLVKKKGFISEYMTHNVYPWKVKISTTSKIETTTISIIFDNSLLLEATFFAK